MNAVVNLLALSSTAILFGLMPSPLTFGCFAVVVFLAALDAVLALRSHA